MSGGRSRRRGSSLGESTACRSFFTGALSRAHEGKAALRWGSAAFALNQRLALAAFAADDAMREVTRPADFFGITPLLAARASARSAAETSVFAAASPLLTAVRAFFTAVRSALFRA